MRRKIVIATGIYPPAIGGPAQYAKNMFDVWSKTNKVRVKTYGIEHKLPTGIRHLYYMLKIIPSVIWCDFVFALDTYSVGLPTAIVSKIFSKKFIIRTGGDFLWESYVERTGKKVFLSEFYNKTMNDWTRKEKTIFNLTRWVLHMTDSLIFSTNWQKDIWLKPYNLEKKDIKIVENYYGPKEESHTSKNKQFIAGTRQLVWKNLDVLKAAFETEEVRSLGAILDMNNYKFEKFMEQMSKTYAVILTSLGDISPNMILDAIRHNKPFIITEENGLMDRIGKIAISVKPLNIEDIKSKIIWLCDEKNYSEQRKKIENFNFVHTWEDIANEIIEICKAA